MKWIRKIRRKRRSSVTLHYLQYKEQTRKVIHEKLQYWNQFYNLEYKRVAIRNQRRSWGSCTSLKNLNFSYRILFLPPLLQDYIVVHELCHLQELNHSQSFWQLVSQQIPEYKTCIAQLRAIEKTTLPTQTNQADIR